MIMPKKYWIPLVGLPVMILSFQNCSDFTVQQSIMEQSSMASGQSLLDSQELPYLTDPARGPLVRWYQQGQPSKVDKGYSGADKLSYVFAADRAMTGQLFAAYSGSAGAEETSVSVASGKITVNRIFSAGNSAQATVNVPALGQQMVIALRTGTKAEDFSLLVNGVVQTLTITKTGAPQEFSYVVKTLAAGTTGGKIYEYMVFNDRLNNAQLNSISRLIGTNNSISQVMFDPAIFADSSGSTSPTVDTKLAAAKVVIDSYCLSCHGAGSSKGDFSNMTAASMITRGFVKAGQPLSSSLYYRMKGTQGGGTKNMPDNGVSLSATQLQAVYDWISSIQ
ncbi:c-type cytochrome [Bdellovibrio sp. HCB209]|uniref:c-type cytochrome n=1 Tax=Bdellovibrio sp. HCB209 TaxID=3394354 RepID=UPI0039B51722